MGLKEFQVFSGNNQTLLSHINNKTNIPAEHLMSLETCMHPDAIKLAEDFLKIKRGSNSDVERDLYSSMGTEAFIKRLYTNRCNAFYGPFDFFLKTDAAGKVYTGYASLENVLDLTKPYNHPTSIGDVVVNNESLSSNTYQLQKLQYIKGYHLYDINGVKTPFGINDVLTYDEIAVSAILCNFWCKTTFFNNCNRFNKAKVDENHIKEGYMYAAAGARFEHLHEVEGRHLLVGKAGAENELLTASRTDYVNAVANALNIKVADIIYNRDAVDKVFRTFYGGDASDTAPVACDTAPVACTGPYCIAERLKANPALAPLLNNLHLNITGYKKRMEMNIDPFIRVTEKHNAKILRCVGLGLGFWQACDTAQHKALFEVYDTAICKYYTSPKTPNNTERLIASQFAWDGASYVGNEYYGCEKDWHPVQGCRGKAMLTQSGDPAAACATQVARIMNPKLNPDQFSKAIENALTDVDFGSFRQLIDITGYPMLIKRGKLMIKDRGMLKTWKEHELILSTTPNYRPNDDPCGSLAYGGLAQRGVLNFSTRPKTNRVQSPKSKSDPKWYFSVTGDDDSTLNMAAATKVEMDGWINAIRYVSNPESITLYRAKTDVANLLANKVKSLAKSAASGDLGKIKSAVTKLYRTTANSSLIASDTYLHFIGMGSSRAKCQELKTACEIDDTDTSDYPKITAFMNDPNNREPGDRERVVVLGPAGVQLAGWVERDVIEDVTEMPAATAAQAPPLMKDSNNREPGAAATTASPLKTPSDFLEAAAKVEEPGAAATTASPLKTPSDFLEAAAKVEEPAAQTPPRSAEEGGRKSRKNRTLTKRRTLQNRRRYSTNTKGKKMRRRSRHIIRKTL